MGYHMKHSVINPNQLRHFGTKVQDDPTSDRITEDNSFCMDLIMDGTMIYAETLTEHEIHNCPHVLMSPPHAWNPHKAFLRTRKFLCEEVGSLRLLSAMNSVGRGSDVILDNNDLVFSLDRMTRKIATLSSVLGLTPVIQMFR